MFLAFTGGLKDLHTHICHMSSIHHHLLCAMCLWCLKWSVKWIVMSTCINYEVICRVWVKYQWCTCEVNCDVYMCQHLCICIEYVLIFVFYMSNMCNMYGAFESSDKSSLCVPTHCQNVGQHVLILNIHLFDHFRDGLRNI